MVEVPTKDVGEVRDKFRPSLEVRYDIEEKQEKYIKKELMIQC